MRHQVIFDFDGTLHDSMHIYPRAFQEAYDWLASEGYVAPRRISDEEITGNIGLTATEAWDRFAPQLPREIAVQAAAIVGKAMDRMIEDGTARLFPGVPEMLQRMKDLGYTCLFLSNCRTRYEEAARKSFGLDRWISAFYNAESFGDIPKEEIFITIANVWPGPFVMVGDRYKDLAVARVHHLPSVGCTYGYGSLEELAGATLLANSPAEIPECVLAIDHDERRQAGRLGVDGARCCHRGASGVQ